MLPDYLYQWVFLTLCSLFCWAHNSKLLLFHGEDGIIRFGNSTNNWAKALLLFVIIFIGTRPISPVFVDMGYYAASYQLRNFDYMSDSAEFIWIQFQRVCYHIFGMSSQVWLFFVTLFSLTFRYLACKSIFKENILTAFLFVITSFYFWGSSTNIIRSDLAFSIAIYGMATMIKEKSMLNFILALLFFCIAFFIHRSSILLIVSFLASCFYVKDIKWTIAFWILCVLLSLFFSDLFVNLFVGMGFDDRVEQYLSKEADADVFSHVGFRWDFLLYSIIPIIVGWFMRKKTDDKIFSILLNTYILANSFWVLVIRAQFSDRFAGISWMMFGIVLAYSLVKVNVWKNQHRIITYGLTGQLLFLWLMQIYYM